MKSGIPFIVPVARGSSEERIKENFQDVQLTEDDLSEINVGAFQLLAIDIPRWRQSLLSIDNQIAGLISEGSHKS